MEEFLCDDMGFQRKDFFGKLDWDSLEARKLHVPSHMWHPRGYPSKESGTLLIMLREKKHVFPYRRKKKEKVNEVQSIRGLLRAYGFAFVHSADGPDRKGSHGFKDNTIP
eukprot:scaffold131223_cov63-Attheya_sp.AAC.2